MEHWMKLDETGRIQHKRLWFCVDDRKTAFIAVVITNSLGKSDSSPIDVSDRTIANLNGNTSGPMNYLYISPE